MSAETPFRQFGARLAELRKAAGIARQMDFAARLKIKQQTVSRWEAGISRPREKQLPEIATALAAPGVKVVDLANELRVAAGYTVKTVVTTFDQPFPVDALLPETFERFCVRLVARLFPTAKVHRVGGVGHTQDGADITATFDDGTVHSFQCKRTEEFGPQKVHEAVAKHTVKAQKKFLLLSRTASPQAREAIASHEGWDIWDKDDLSEKIRSLARVEQLAIVDTFFAGRRFELLGVTEEGVWETPHEFFAAFENAGGLFNHTWTLVGREEALKQFVSHLQEAKARVVFLVGAGGSGKSRVLKQGIEQIEAKQGTVHFLSRTAEVTKKSLEELGSKSGLLVVDDAHDRNDLPLLFQYAATTEGVTLVLALRPYGADHLKAQAANFSLANATAEVKLEPLTKAASEELAKQVLKKEGGPLAAAKDIANLTYDCPLATVVGAQIVAREKKHIDLATNESAFRTTLFGRFEAVIAGEIGQKADAEPLKKLLRVLSLFQPFYLDDRALLALIEKLEGIQPHDSNRLLKLLIESGVLFKRGARYRLSPDVLADYIIEAACVGNGGQSTGYAEKAFDAADDRLIQVLLLNLGRLDWRLSNGDASNSDLLSGIWAKLKPSSEYADPHIKSVQSIAFYQPLRAIEFGEELIRQGKFTKQLAEIFKYAAYNLNFLPRSCAALWYLGRSDDRPLNQHPTHPVRILAELCEVQPNKPLSYNEGVIEFGLQVAKSPQEWSHRYTPLDFLTSIFETEGHSTTAKSNKMVFNPFTVSPEAVAKLRQRVLDEVIGLLGNENVRVAAAAAASLGKALRYPIGMFNATISDSLRAKWTKLFCLSLEDIERAVKSNTYDPIVLVGIAKSVSWHAVYSQSDTKKYAKRVRDALSVSLDYRTLATLIDGYGSEFRRTDVKNYEANLKKHQDALAADLFATYPDGELLRKYLEKLLDHIHKASTSASSSPYVLLWALFVKSEDFARATLSNALINPESPTARFAANALNSIWSKDVEQARKIADAMLESGNEKLIAQVGGAMMSLDFKSGRYGEPELAIVERLVVSEREATVRTGVAAIRAVMRGNAEAALKLARLVNVGSYDEVADELLCLFTFSSDEPALKLDETDIELFLEKLMPVQELRGHWTETFLALASSEFPTKTLEFFKRRVEKAVADKTWDYRPVNHGPYVHVPLKFRENPDYGSLLAKTISWMAQATHEKERQVLFQYRSRELFEAAFGSFDDEVVQYLNVWSLSADESGFRLIANILREAPYTFIFTQNQLVVSLLTRAQRVSTGAFEAMKSALYSSAVGGMRTGTAGEPFPRDLEAKAECERVLDGLSKFSPAFELYDIVLKNAEAEIVRALRDREEFEED